MVSTAELGTGNGVNTSHPLSNILSYILECLVALVQSISVLKKPILIYLSKFVLFLLKVLHFYKKYIITPENSGHIPYYRHICL